MVGIFLWREGLDVAFGAERRGEKVDDTFLLRPRHGVSDRC